MKLYNTLSKTKETLRPIDPSCIKIYHCGPTVYNYIHIGNARPLCAFDVLYRYLRFKGENVHYVMNFTDIDDKIIKKANDENCDYLTISQKYIKEFQKDAQGLNILPATLNPRATENMGEIIDMISSLIKKGFAYRTDTGDVYFSPSKFSGYGKLSHQPLEDLRAGARITSDEEKRAPEDFALWKSAKPGEPFWDSPFGKGRPGWHIECSAMVCRHLGETIDIHCGGQDLVFPHHENEIAQSEACNGVPFANIWIHNGHVNIDNKKMSKSLGNFFTVRDVANEYGYEPIRYLMVSSHYRMPISYSLDSIKQSAASLERLYNCRNSLEHIIKNSQNKKISSEEETAFEAMNNHRSRFICAMDDDLNTADAISCIFDLARDINRNIMGEPPSKQFCERSLELFMSLCDVLGLVYLRDSGKIDSGIEQLIQLRQQARLDKNWAEADRIRDELTSMGIVLEDTPGGIRWKMK